MVIATHVKSFRCPLAQSEFVNPVMSTLCRHTFSKDYLLQWLAGQSRQCPVAGCRYQLSEGVLKPNRDMVRKVAHAKRKRDDDIETI